MFLLRRIFCFLLLLSVSCIPDDGANIRLKRAETFYTSIGSEPENLHPIKSTDLYATVVQSYMLESLMERNYDTYKFQPQLAEKYNISPDGRYLTFHLKKNLKWSDGKPLTADDVKFTLEASKNPAYGGVHFIPYLEGIKSARVKNKTTVIFETKEAYFKNFEILAGLQIIPKHIYADPKARLNKTLIGSGPYKIGKYLKGKMIILTQNSNWQGANYPANKNRWNFKNIVIRFVSEETDKILRLQKENIDYSDLSPEAYERKTSQHPWGTKVLKIKIKNQSAKGYSYIGFNFKNPLFQDVRLRRALAHLMNRNLMNQKFHFNHSELARGPWYFWSDYADSSIPAIKFDPKKARALLKQAGWRDNNKDGILEKRIGNKLKTLSFTITFSNEKSEKYLTLYKEDLKKEGIDLKLNRVDWTTFVRSLDDKKFDAVMLGWSGGQIDLDPKQIWHSKSAEKGGSNFISYSNPKVDKLIDQGRKQMNKQDRIKYFKQVYRHIAKDTPYIFMFSSRVYFYGVNQRVKRPKDTFKYFIGAPYWSLKQGL